MNPTPFPSLPARDAAHVWHPFTAMAAYVEEGAPVIVAAEGFELIDADGRRYLDGHSSLWCNIHGHRVPEIDTAIREQLDKVAHSTLLGLANQPSIELAEAIVQRTPAGLTRVFYTDCGAAGVEAALKIAWQYHRQKPGGPEPRDLFVCLGSAYHGDTVGTISLGGIDRFHSLFGGLMFPSLRVPTPATPGLSLDDCLAETESLLTANADRIAGFVIEPLVQAAAGILVHPPGYLRRIRELTSRLGILLIADEIAVGFGRLGTLFACEQEDVSPDVLILSKGLTGGYLPLAATLVTDEIYSAFLGDPWQGRTFQHGHTYTGNPLACAAALASLRLIEQNDVLGNARRIENLLERTLKPRDSNPWASQITIRQRGTMVGIELLQDVAARTPYPPELRMGHLVTLACRQRGVIVRNIGDVAVLMPAPAMPLELVQRLCDVVREAVDEVLAAIGAWKTSAAGEVPVLSPLPRLRGRGSG
jgi:adenosylmethionine---8-amino-7-oxononanoate aminotransferase